MMEKGALITNQHEQTQGSLVGKGDAQTHAQTDLKCFLPSVYPNRQHLKGILEPTGRTPRFPTRVLGLPKPGYGYGITLSLPITLCRCAGTRFHNEKKTNPLLLFNERDERYQCSLQFMQFIKLFLM